jgi:uncharacterized protein YmfQ (DUF2313 family)
MSDDQHVTRSGDDYAEALQGLLPLGQAWPRDNDSTLMKVVRGLTGIWGDIEIRASTLLEVESDPRSTIELLPDWERNWGLPDPCYSSPQNIGQRQLALVMRMTMEGGQSREFFISVAAMIGYTITITEYRTFICGIDRCGDNRVYGDGSDPMYDEWGRPIKNPLGVNVAGGELSEWPNYGVGPPENRFYWTVHVTEAALIWFRTGASQAADLLLDFGLADDLECLLNRWKPAHTQIIFDYSNLSNPDDPMSGLP